jgi:hypothetical protein
MRRLSSTGLARPATLTGLVCGGLVGLASAMLAGGAIAQHADPTPRAVLEATHNPPFLTLPGEQLELSYQTHCAPAQVEDPERACDVSGSVFVRSGERGPFSQLPLVAQQSNGLHELVTTVPEDLAAARNGLEYYAVLGSGDAGPGVVLPSGGATAPDRLLRMDDPIEVDLGTHSFGKLHRRSARVASARWGEGATNVGLEQDRDLSAVGATAFDVDASGSVYLLDEENRRVLRWERGQAAPASVPVSIEGRLADMSVAGDGTIYVLESVAPPGRNPLLRHFDENGRDLDVVETAERPSQIRASANGPVVLEQPSDQWMPAEVDGQPAQPVQQRLHGRSPRPLRSGGEVIVRRLGAEIRVALLASGRVRRGWRITSAMPLGEVQLAEPLGQRLVLVTRVYSDAVDEFVVLVLDRNGIAQRFSVDPADWAESAPLGRFRLVNGSLYQLGSSPAGAFVDRFDLEVQ